jgi:hypothetical protein
MNPQTLVPVLFAPLILFILYRRFRRNFGRQPIQPKRMGLRIGILAIVSAALLITALRDMALFGGGLAGLAVGAVLGVVGLRLIRFEFTPQGNFYTPNGYIGGAVSVLLIGRLLYRFLVLAPTSQAPDPNPFAAFQRSPLTLAIFTVLVGYYITLYVGIFLAGRAHRRSASLPGTTSNDSLPSEPTIPPESKIAP